MNQEVVIKKKYHEMNIHEKINYRHQRKIQNDFVKAMLDVANAFWNGFVAFQKSKTKHLYRNING